jgi:hypothetical protein
MTENPDVWFTPAKAICLNRFGLIIQHFMVPQDTVLEMSLQNGNSLSGKNF